MAFDKQKALETAMSQIEKQFGKGAVMRLGQNAAMQVDAIPTGSLSLDLALGIGGLPRGRITEIYGPESSGKTTLALHCIAEGQKNGGIAAFIDVEHALDPGYAKALGGDIDDQPQNQDIRNRGAEFLELESLLICGKGKRHQRVSGSALGQSEDDRVFLKSCHQTEQQSDIKARLQHGKGQINKIEPCTSAIDFC